MFVHLLLSLQYNLRVFTDTNSVICRIIVGGLASLFEGGGICEANDGGSVVRTMGHSPSQKSKIFASPLYTRGPYQPQKRRKIYECNRCCQTGGGIWYNRTKVVETYINNGLLAVFNRTQFAQKHKVHSKSEVKFTSLLWLV